MASRYKKNVHHHSLNKCKTRPQWDIISHMWEWPTSKTKQINKQKPSTGCGVQGTSYTSGRNGKWSVFMKVVQRCLKTLNMDLPFYLVIPLLGIYPSKLRNTNLKGDLHCLVLQCYLLLLNYGNNLNAQEQMRGSKCGNLGEMSYS